ncbi:hypothetical protein E1293_45050 [Actinomadura darangshiensis]|uniref:Uncharacterized protein n=1 Tax=Actinomadura darangshiensis TaxID=705336 RepID=A0A4R4ZVZ4_9ACTN|nr:hypothetical protein [Actinomadura darangshiensis]TDD61322.1 hypothetical protein E1293_45050 [Actinomadura darangshiensis]
MTEASPAGKVDRQAWAAVYTLLTQATDLAADDIPITSKVLEAGAFGECRAWQLPEGDTPSWVLRQTRYQIACTLALPPRDPDDPLIDTVLEVLARHPTAIQARVLRAAATHLPNDSAIPRRERPAPAGGS